MKTYDRAITWVIALGACVSAGACANENDTAASGSGLDTASLTGPLEGGLGTGDEAGGPGSGGAEGDGAPRLDVEDGGQGGPGDCTRPDPGMAEVDFTDLWVANSMDGAGTLSRIDTRTGVELARYATGPERRNQPSRTSVNLHGDVVVANRGNVWTPVFPATPGGVTKFAARLDDCIDRNGNGTIETSDGTEPLEWSADECMIWNHPIPSDSYERGPRPLAWEGGVNADGCADPSPNLWVGWYEFAGPDQDNVGHFEYLSGTTGEVLDTVDVHDWGPLAFGPYGGAVNADNDFWAIGYSVGPLIRIDHDTHEVHRYDFPRPPGASAQAPAYGLALDERGDPWVSVGGVAAHFNVDAEVWTYVETGNVSMRGLNIDREGRGFFAVDMAEGAGPRRCGVAVVDTRGDLVISEFAEIEGCIRPVGVGVDVDGFVWVVDQAVNNPLDAWAGEMGVAYKMNPDTYAIEQVVEGLKGPYTYSDMTGSGLRLVTAPPTG